MINFIEYVVTEFKSKRLSKQNALDLIKQFSSKSQKKSVVESLHPLLHKNISNLAQQAFESSFTGEDFFLNEHQVRLSGSENSAPEKVLPGVAYLEMARAAIAESSGMDINAYQLSLRNIVWAQPVIVETAKSVSIALFSEEQANKSIDYEVYSGDGNQEVIHCQGQAILKEPEEKQQYSLDLLKSRMTQGQLKAQQIYQAYSEMGLEYGSSFRGIRQIYQGEGEVLAEISLAEVSQQDLSVYLIHPGIMDSALQASIGLSQSISGLGKQASIPFALEELTLFSACRNVMFVWIRYSKDNQISGKVEKFDLDLMDDKGQLCIQMKGFSTRSVGGLESPQLVSETSECLQAVPVWQTVDIDSSKHRHFDQRYLVLCDLSAIDVKTLNIKTSDHQLGENHLRILSTDTEKNLAENYQAIGKVCFKQLQDLLKSKPTGKILFQIVIANQGETAVLAGLSGLLKTAMLENPQLHGQLILTEHSLNNDVLNKQLAASVKILDEGIIRFQDNQLSRLSWLEVAPVVTPDLTSGWAFKAQGVYLITGGLGGLGRIWAQEILSNSPQAKVILTGRQNLTAKEWNSHKKKLLKLLSLKDAQLSYHKLDLNDLSQVQQLISQIVDLHHQLNGIIHTAGMIADNFILHKTEELFDQVLMPKVAGTYHLDKASEGIELDFMLLFSSVVSCFGNSGQSDYATANGFIDQFAVYRNGLVAAKKRQGQTLSINWPLWAEGGMRIAAESRKQLQQATGMQPMKSTTGLSVFYQSLYSGEAQVLAMEGDLVKLKNRVFDGSSMVHSEHKAQLEENISEAVPVQKLVTQSSGSLFEPTQEYIKKQLSSLLKLPAHRIDPEAAMEKYGIDSILAMELTNQLEKTFGSLPKTLFFEYQTLADLTGYFVKSYATQLTTLFTLPSRDEQAVEKQSEYKGEVKGVTSGSSEGVSEIVGRRVKRRSRSGLSIGVQAQKSEAIAIIGLSGRYPESRDIEAYWENLREGQDCIIEVPKERWDWQAYLTEDRNQSGYHYSKWGGFIEGVDEFDPLFFNISPLEAEGIDPQERLFLQHAWMAVEDAGYTRLSLQMSDESASDQSMLGQVGVYVGVMYSEYQLFGAEASVQGKRMGVAGSYASIANRVSYALNIHGPSMAIDTMCSSSLASIHLACQDLKQGRTNLAIAGGVNVSIHPSKYLVLSAGQFISSEGHCQSFGEGGEGYIPGEGVGAVVLKRLSEAERDKHPIYGVIKGSSLNHGGKTNGYTVPNPQAQASAILGALKEAKVEPRQLSYIEAHGTGTKLGDPIEIAALSKAFYAVNESLAEASSYGFCLIGSAKSNIGHCESAAGIAGLTKVLLQMKHRQIVPSLHSKALNPHIDFERSPFVVNQRLTEWEQPLIEGIAQPRLAGISSFGAGGSNAHMIVEEYNRVNTGVDSELVEPVVVLLSARTEEQLMQKTSELLSFVQTAGDEIDLSAMAYTLQVGREAMEERLGLLVNSVSMLVTKLTEFVAGEVQSDDVYRGQLKRDQEGILVISQDDDMSEAIDKWIKRKKFTKLLELWVKGLDLDWGKFYPESRPSLMNLPTYPFARNRYWVDTSIDGVEINRQGLSQKFGDDKAIHPFLHLNTSDFHQQSYTSTFTGDEFFLSDHQVAIGQSVDGEMIKQKVLPAVAYLEMITTAINNAMPDKSGEISIQLKNTAWIQPIVVDQTKTVKIALSPNQQEQIEYQIYSTEKEEEFIHCQGLGILNQRFENVSVDLKALKSQMNKESLAAEVIYETFEKMGIFYGDSYQGIRDVYRGEQELLAQISLNPGSTKSESGFVLHPNLMDSAIQSLIGFKDNLEQAAEQLLLPFSLDSLIVHSHCQESMYVWARYADGSGSDDEVLKFDIDLIDESGSTCVQMLGFSCKELNIVQAKSVNQSSQDIMTTGELFAYPEWENKTITLNENSPFKKQYVLLADLFEFDSLVLQKNLLNSQCVKLKNTKQFNLAERYTSIASQCFTTIQQLLQQNKNQKTLLQVVLKIEQEQSIFAGLSGMLKTMELENPLFKGQILLVKSKQEVTQLATRIMQEINSEIDSIVRLDQNERQVISWKELPLKSENNLSEFKDEGVYLITGGLGGLGLIFVEEILNTTNNAKIIVTGRAKRSKAITQKLAQFSSANGEVKYIQLDLTDLSRTQKALTDLEDQFGKLNGIIHSAGLSLDNFILKKSESEFKQVLEPKVTGTFNLDRASRKIELDFMVLFSSVSGISGNLGQADYAAANGFMDQFASLRNRQVANNQRSGHTLSINWPLWKDGGMKIDPDSEALLQQVTGVQPMNTKVGMGAFYQSLRRGLSQSLVMQGRMDKMRQILWPTILENVVSNPVDSELEETIESLQSINTEIGTNPSNTLQKAKGFLVKEFSELLKMSHDEIETDAALENYGIDSIMAMKLTNQLETTFGTLSKTLFFEYQTISALAGYLVKNHKTKLLVVTGTQAKPEKRVTSGLSQKLKLSSKLSSSPASKVSFGNQRFVNYDRSQQQVAIVGISGRYPQADSLTEFWDNLKQGKDCITEIPIQRWDNQQYYNPSKNNPGKTYSKWGGFINDVDKFDTLFFNISPKEAELIDPQERLFIETVWHTIEDAGYSKESLSAKNIAVYVGVMYGQYELFGAEALLKGENQISGSSFASIANRVSYFFNFHGPSMALDTMCSSSLTAIHLACEEIYKGEVEAAIAGGVNVSIHPYKYINLSQGNFVASDGRCRSFGDGGDGYVPGEGVGAVLLKSLSKALSDGDNIQAIIKSSSINHGGKTNGYTVPNPVAQADLILNALKKSNISPNTLGYIETHGTGTSLGDPIEITGLEKAFEGYEHANQFCPIGSVKSNIGHLESAAGIAALTKVLLQLKHKQLVPSLHATPLNPNINFENSPFYVQRELSDWQRPENNPRRVAVSSFGAGGANSHIIVEDYEDEREFSSLNHEPQLFVLSAKTQTQLAIYAKNMMTFLDDSSDLLFGDMIYTAQIGRSPMDERLAIICSNTTELLQKLEAWLQWQQEQKTKLAIEDVYCANVKQSKDSAKKLIIGEAGDAFVQIIMGNRDFDKVAKLWVTGLNVDWALLYQKSNYRRLSLPTYPFVKERYWVKTDNSIKPQLLVNKQLEPNAISKTTLQQSPAKALSNFSTRWREQKLSSSLSISQEKQNLLLIGGSVTQITEALKEVLTDSEKTNLILVTYGANYQQFSPSLYQVNAGNEDDFEQLITSLSKTNQIPDKIIHQDTSIESLSLKPLSSMAASEHQKYVTDNLNRGVYSILFLARSLMKIKNQNKLGLISAFWSLKETNNPLAEAMSGFLKTLKQENPHFSTKTIEFCDTQGGSNFSSTEVAKIMVAELMEGGWNADEVCYRNNTHQEEIQRKVKEIVSVELDSEPQHLPLKQQGVYLITGGLGGVGYLVSKYLISRFNARLILVGRTELNSKIEQKISQLGGGKHQIAYFKVDVADSVQVKLAVEKAKHKFTSINGVFHCAGVHYDSFILNKTKQEMDRVLAVKVFGTLNIDAALKNESLDFLALFSSIAGVTGNLGQSDYAYGNKFLDAFAMNRAQLSLQNKRIGKTLSINWPYWQDGGMTLLQSNLDLIANQSGMHPLPTSEAIEYLESILGTDLVQGIPLYGEVNKISRYLTHESVEIKRPKDTLVSNLDGEQLFLATEKYLKKLLSEEIKLVPERIDSDERFETFGIDSVMINHFNAQLEKDLGSLPKTLIYEYETVTELTQYLVVEEAQRLMAYFNLETPRKSLLNVAKEHKLIKREQELVSDDVAKNKLVVQSQLTNDNVAVQAINEDIAIIGIHGSYPQSLDLDEYWQNLIEGKDLIEEVPEFRWDYEEFFDPDPAAAAAGKIYCKWGGFLHDIDQFDPDFFNISSNEARLIDPQERLFLGSVWAAIEEAGYTRESLKQKYPKGKSADVGVFVGVTTNSYHLLTTEEWDKGNMASPGALPWSIANRISYFFNFQGPSMPIDTACSSSLVAIHMACESLKRNESQLAVAGGVNLYLHPSKYLSFCQRQMLSQSGKCFSFGAGDDGFVPGEGVGSLLLKPLNKAIEDRDHIHGIIAASAFEHSGRSNGYSAPNPNSQASLIRDTLVKADIHPESIGYVEGHGTGTQLGDSLEIAALTNAFKEQTENKNFCSVGSVKANIGHSESAAGIAGITKILLQMKNQKLVPSIHSEEVNPNISFENSPFYLQHEVSHWEKLSNSPRRAMINSFGAGGVNACMVLQEYESNLLAVPTVDDKPLLAILSAKDELQLKKYAKQMYRFLAAETSESLDLAEICYTLQVGREAMQERLAIIFTERDQLLAGFKSFCQCETIIEDESPRYLRGSIDVSLGNQFQLSEEDKNLMMASIDSNDQEKLAHLWIVGADITWGKLYQTIEYSKISLPTYPFGEQSYWVSDSSLPAKIEKENNIDRLHPLVSYNSSTMKDVSFNSLLKKKAFYGVDHKVNDEPIFPGAGFLEIACISGSIAAEKRVRRIKDIVWSQPLSFIQGDQQVRTYLKTIGQCIEYQVTSLDQDREKVAHSEGRLFFDESGSGSLIEHKKVSITDLIKQSNNQQDGKEYYQKFKTFGFDYGRSFQTIKEFFVNESFALSKLSIGQHLKDDFDQYILHPSVIDGALQTVIGLVKGGGNGTAYLPFAIDEVEIIRPLLHECYVHVEFADNQNSGTSNGLLKFNLQLLSEQGEVLVKLNNFYVRAFESANKKSEII